MTRSLYDILGVPENADDEAIRKAYRRKAQKVHPDKEDGDTEEFQRLVKAYETLMDSTRRKIYDETGEVVGSTENNNAALREMLAILFMLVDGICDLEHENLIEEAKKVVQHGMNKGRNKKEEQLERIESRNTVIGRLSHKGGDSTVVEALASDILRIQEAIKKIDASIKIGEDMMVMLSEYEYRTDAKPPAAWKTMDNNPIPSYFFRAGSGR